MMRVVRLVHIILTVASNHQEIKQTKFVLARLFVALARECHAI